MRVRLLAVAAILSVLPTGALADPNCRVDVRHAAGRSAATELVISQGTRQQLVIFDRTTSGCEFGLGQDHGRAHLMCQPGLQGLWGLSSWYDARALDHHLRRIRVDGSRLPRHPRDQRRILAPVYAEGVQWLDGDQRQHFLDHYPRRFTRIGGIEALPHENVRIATQRVSYVAMSGRPVEVAMARVEIACLRMFAVAYVDRNEVEAATRQLGTFVSSARVSPLP
jgi:hypothetical protein